MQTNKDAIILGEVTQIPLWSFELEVKDRRTGDYYSGYTVEAGNEDYDLDIAEDTIKKRYAQLGYEVTSCTYKAERIYTFEAIKEFESADESDGKRQPEHIDHEPKRYEMTAQLMDEDDIPEDIRAALDELDD